MNKKTGHIFKQLFLLVSVYFILFLIIFFSTELSSGIKNGMNVSMNLIIPSTFVFMIISNIIIHSNLKYVISRPFRFLAKYIFRISEHNLAIVILSLVGGYPIGAKLISNAVSQNRMSREEASNLLCYCVNCGPAFLISGIGVTIFSSFQIGLFMYLSQIIACVCIGFILSFFNRKFKKTDNPQRENESCSYPALFVNSVNDSVKSLAVICGFVIAFSAIMPIVSIPLNRLGGNYAAILQGFLEVTTGCSSLAGLPSSSSILQAAAFTAFGGICVHLQVYVMISQNHIKMTKFFIFRILYTLISVFSMKLLLAISPETANCISYNSNVNPDLYSVSPIATIFMILLGIMLLFFTKKSDKMKMRKQ